VAKRSDINKEYEVGFGKPPKSGRFKKGQSGNPKGRPKGSHNLTAIFQRTVFRQVKVNENGVTRKITRFEAVVLQLTNKAASGNVAAAKELIRWTEQIQQSAVRSMPMPSTSIHFLKPELEKRGWEPTKEKH
jgi:hypothetical protein